MRRLSLGLPRHFVHRSFRVFSCSNQEMEKKRRIAEVGPAETKQKKVLSLRKNNARSAKGVCYLQIFGTGMDTRDTSPSVLLFFDSKRFVFNAGEGLQRFCQDYKIKLSKIDHVMLTRVCSETAGGLPGALLTLAGEVGLTVNIWGPSDLQYLVTAMSTYLPNASFYYTRAFGRDGKLIQDDGGDSSIAVLIEDDVVKISAVLLNPFSNEGEEKTFKAGDVAVAYVCELPEVKGKFDPEKAAALGLRPGRKYSQLQSGSSVMSDDGSRKIFPNDVMEPSSPGPKAILVDCPTVSHIPALLMASGLRKFYKNEGAPIVACVVHLGPAIVINDSRYQEWMKNFGCTQHILAGSGCSQSLSPVLKSSARILYKLNLACPDVFPASGFPPEQSEDRGTLVKQSDVLSTEAARNLLKFRLLPLTGLGLDDLSVPEAFSPEIWQNSVLQEVPEMLSVAEQVKKLWQAYDCKLQGKLEESCLDTSTNAGADDILSSLPGFMRDIPEALKNMHRKELELVFLGTGSSQPSTCRNVSGIYVNCFAKGGMLLDCGEGTYGQMIRRYGAGGAHSLISRLRFIWISHIHADHHGGLARILSARRRILGEKIQNLEPLLVVGPKQLKPVLEAYERVEDLHAEFLDCCQTAAGVAEQDASQEYHLPDDIGRSKLQSILAEMGLCSLVSVPVIHCRHAYGVVIEAQAKPGSSGPGWKLAYSGDTRPCKAFVEAARGTTVFIHEATFEDGMSEEAITKMHSSTQEAIQAGVLAQAYRIILTHFSQRYSKVPVFDENYNDKTFIAFDLMSIDAVDFPLLPALVPVLKMLFRNEQTEEGDVDEEVVDRM